MRHADYKERNEQGGAKEGGGEAGSGVQVGRHVADGLRWGGDDEVGGRGPIVAS